MPKQVAELPPTYVIEAQELAFSEDSRAWTLSIPI
jgi:hypothetical protein